MRFAVNIPCFGDFADPRAVGDLAATDVVGPLAEAGATRWDERQLQRRPDIDSLSAVLPRVEAGPPSV